jgi:glucose-1-phosphate thymidylyltransferase
MNSEVGPNVSIEEGSVIQDSVITNSIIQEKSVIRKSKLDKSTIGNHVEITGESGTVHVGDHSIINHS